MMFRQQTGEFDGDLWSNPKQDASNTSDVKGCRRTVCIIVDIVERGPLRPRIGSSPQKKADPFEIAFAAELPEGHISLSLQLLCEVRAVPFAIQIYAECRLHAFT